MWLIYLHSAVKIQSFSPNFPLGESTVKVFGWLFLWNFKKALTVFYGTASWITWSKRLCYRKWLTLFSLKFQRDNRKNVLAVIPPRGKPEKGCIFHRTVEMKQPHTITIITESFSLGKMKSWMILRLLFGSVRKRDWYIETFTFAMKAVFQLYQIQNEFFRKVVS